MDFPFFSTKFMFWVLFTWICELLIWFEIFGVSVMGWMNVCLCLDFWVLLIRFLGFYFCFHGWYWLSMSIDLFDVWISYPLCHDYFWFTVMPFVCVFGWFKMVVFRRWAICLNCLWLSCVFLLSFGYCLLCIGLNSSYSLCHISLSYALFWLSVFYTKCGVLLALYNWLMHVEVCVWFYPLELSCLRCCVLWSLRSLCVMH